MPFRRGYCRGQAGWTSATNSGQAEPGLEPVRELLGRRHDSSSIKLARKDSLQHIRASYPVMIANGDEVSRWLPLQAGVISGDRGIFCRS